MTKSVSLIAIELFRSSLLYGISCVIFVFWDLMHFIEVVIFVCRVVHSIIPSLSIRCLQGLKRQLLFLTSPLSFVILVICVFHLIFWWDLIEVSQFSWSLKKKKDPFCISLIFLYHFWCFQLNWYLFCSLLFSFLRLNLGLFCSFSRFLEGNLDYWFETFPFSNICILCHTFLS